MGRVLLLTVPAIFLAFASIRAAPSSDVAPEITTTTLADERPQEAAPHDRKRQSSEQHPQAPIVLNQYFTREEGHPEPKNEAGHEAINTGAYVATAFATLALVVLGCIVARAQVRLMRDTMKATRDAADAAKDSAEHVRRTERAWVLGHSNGPLKGWITPNENLDAPFEGRIIQLDWGLSNHGKTPAWITKADIRFEVHDWPLPNEPFVVDLRPWNNFPVTTTKAHGGSRYLIIKDKDEWTTLLQSYRCFVFYGMVVYRDAFGHQHWGRFCETWRSPQELLARLSGRLNFTPTGPTAAWTDQDWG